MVLYLYEWLVYSNKKEQTMVTWDEDESHRPYAK